MGLIISVLIGAVAGWLASQLMKSTSNGMLMNIILGILGGFVGSFIFDIIGLNSTNWLGRIITATVGASVLIWLYRQLRKK